MLDHRSPTTLVRLAGWALAAAAVVALVPMKLVARSSAAIAMAPQEGQTQEPKSPTPPVEEVVTSKPHREGSGFSYMLALGDKYGTVMSGDLELGREISDRDRGFWFRRDGRTFQVRDQASVERAAAIVKPMMDIGAQQGEVGAKQGAIGARQGAVGAKQGEVGARQGIVGAKQGELGARQGVLGARQARDLSEDERKQIDREMQQIDRQMRELDEQMKVLDKEMAQVSTPMTGLDGEMEKLSKEMEALGKKMDAASATVDRQLRELAEQLIALGLAKPIN